MSGWSTTKTYIFRITHINNLAHALATRQLFSRNGAPKDFKYTDICKTDLHESRGTVEIPDGGGRTLHDCVPFYFGPRSPMLFWISKNLDQTRIVYLVSTAQQIAAKGYGFSFTDGHAYIEFSKWYKDLKDLDKLDGNAIYARFWSRQFDPTEELKRKKQAEFLVYNSLSWDDIIGVAVYNDKVEKEVRDLMNMYPKEVHKKVQAVPGWYY